ncbi:MAG: hypothetical protein LBQ56_00670, partial [Synergistaceae bacterium]|nr:hypothetical protein [Synergistaceae bacterium]
MDSQKPDTSTGLTPKRGAGSGAVTLGSGSGASSKSSSKRAAKPRKDKAGSVSAAALDPVSPKKSATPRRGQGKKSVPKSKKTLQNRSASA